MNAKNENATNSKRPTHVAYQIVERKGKKSLWHAVGGAWPHADGKGFNLQLHAVPLDGKVVLRLATEKKTNQK